MNLDLIITSFNGRHLLEKHLPNVIKHSPEARNIFVYDDAGTDDTPSWMAKEYSKIIFQRNEKNLGFTKNTNQAVANTDADLIVLLNNDVSPNKNYLKDSLKHFKDEKLFAISFAEKQHSWPRVSWENGKLSFTEGKDRSKARYIAWPSGGSCIMRKDIWNELGGYNEVYSPGYWEDIDLGWRALKENFKILWDPKITVDHRHESTFKKLNKNFVDLLRQRNELLFTWLNITDRNLAMSHYRFILSHIIKHPGYLKVVLAAMRFYPQIAKNRIINRKTAKSTDQDVLQLLNTTYES